MAFFVTGSQLQEAQEDSFAENCLINVRKEKKAAIKTNSKTTIS